MELKFHTLILLAANCQNVVFALIPSVPQKTLGQSTILDPLDEIERRQQTTSRISTCGFKDGRSDQPRTANAGFDCRVDTLNALWGFCPTTVILATDCGLAGACIDYHDCFLGCGITGASYISTFRCSDSGQDFCSTAFLTAGPDQTYSYIACANNPGTEHYYAAPTTTTASASTLSSSSVQLTISSTTSSSLSSTSAVQSTLFLSSSPSTPPLQSLSSKPASDLPANSATTSPSTINTGAIVGGVIGGLALVCFVALALLFFSRYRRYHDVKTTNFDALPPQVPPKGSELPGQTAFPQEKYGIEASLYPGRKNHTLFEMPIEGANSPFELSI